MIMNIKQRKIQIKPTTELNYNNYINFMKTLHVQLLNLNVGALSIKIIYNLKMCKLMLQVTEGCPHLSSLDIGYCYRILKEGTSSVGANAFPKNLTELTLHGVQMPEDLLTELLNKLAYIKVLTLCGMRAVDDDTLDKVSTCKLQLFTILGFVLKCYYN